jgi:multidrug efflux pump subunit AcrA (membrane-fusion protein)
VIRAPVAGTVVNLNATTVGGIIRPGEPILDLVPSDDALPIEARLSPNDIDIVFVGQPARVHLTAMCRRSSCLAMAAFGACRKAGIGFGENFMPLEVPAAEAAGRRLRNASYLRK